MVSRDEQCAAVLAAARDYLGRDWQPIPVPYRSKNPGRDDWQAERRTADDLDSDFGERLVNLGVLTGEPSGGLVDVDLDCAEAIRLADVFLPDTGAVFGRDAKPASHRLYLADEPGRTQQF